MFFIRVDKANNQQDEKQIDQANFIQGYISIDYYDKNTNPFLIKDFFKGR